MTKRGPLVVFILVCITFGIYGIVWAAKTAGEMNGKGAEIPHWILLFIPFVNLWYLWKYSEGVDKVTNGALGAGLSFLLLLLLGPIGMAIAQSNFNKVS